MGGGGGGPKWIFIVYMYKIGGLFRGYYEKLLLIICMHMQMIKYQIVANKLNQRKQLNWCEVITI